MILPLAIAVLLNLIILESIDVIRKYMLNNIINFTKGENDEENFIALSVFNPDDGINGVWQ